ncbi:MAG TPA: hypothetical protein VFH99_02500 [Candidatus Saccharimonadales bacterium]|nr:hypothetical protein [Candidatus Saccharimonadales bacterium]
MGELAYLPDVDKPPIFVSAGIIKTEDQIERFAGVHHIAAQIIGSFSEEEWGGNDPSGNKTVFWWEEKEQAAYNAVGLRNPGREAASEYLPRAIQKLHSVGQMALISVTSLAQEDPQEVLPRLAEWALDMGADGVELDGSCPNHGALLCEDIVATHEITAAVRERVGDQPYISIKFASLPDYTIEQYKQDTRLPVDAITLINAIRQQSPLNPQTGSKRIEVNDGYAGKSGPAIADKARNNLMSWSFNLSGDLPSLWGPGYQLWSVGGVDNGQEIFNRVHDMGAYMVGAAQAFYRTKNPQALAQQWAKEYNEALMPAG